MAEMCIDFCPKIRKLEELANSYNPETAFGYHEGSGEVRAAWLIRHAAACEDARGCDGPVFIGTEEVVVRGSIRQFFRKRIETIPQYACGLNAIES